MTHALLFPVILAGGKGTRLWPLSQPQKPKQFLPLIDENTNLLQTTIDRLPQSIPKENCYIITHHAYLNMLTPQKQAGHQILLEPISRNTAPAIALAAIRLQHLYGNDAMMLALPADHIIKDKDAFHRALHIAVNKARDGTLVTFGIEATSPDTGFGYIKSHSNSIQQDIEQVESFTEKPDGQTAEYYLNNDNYYWNSGMFVWKASAILAAIKQHAPDIWHIIEKIQACWKNESNAQEAINRYYPDMPNISIDYGVLEKESKKPVNNLCVIPCKLGWSDIGNWDALYNASPKDTHNNVLRGSVASIGSKNSLIHSSNRLVVAAGVNNLRIIETQDAVLIAQKGKSQETKELLNALEEEPYIKRPENIIQRPWGTYTILSEGKNFKVKRIEVKPYAKLSLQRHQHRSEHWVVLDGTATVTYDTSTFTITKNQSTYIPIGALHRLENRESTPLKIIETQTGEYLAEDDIERFDDDYGRTVPKIIKLATS